MPELAAARRWPDEPSRAGRNPSPTICIIILPAGVMVSIASVRRRTGFALAQSFHDRQHIAKRMGKSIKLPDHDTVALTELIQ